MAEKLNSDRLPLHRAIIEGIKKVVNDIQNLESRKPVSTPTLQFQTLLDQFTAKKDHEKEMADCAGELRAYLKLCKANISGAHLSEIKTELWKLAYTQNPLIISTLKELEEKKTQST